jgi:hypothetical protein
MNFMCACLASVSVFIDGHAHIFFPILACIFCTVYGFTIGIMLTLKRR